MDNIKNFELKIEDKPKLFLDGNGGCLMAYKLIDETGELSKISIVNTVDVPQVSSGELYQFTVDRILEISDEEFVVEFYKKKKEDVLVKFKIE